MKKKEFIKRKFFGIFVISFLLVLTFGIASMAAGPGSASQKGSYSWLTGAAIYDGSGQTQLDVGVKVDNLTGGSAYMTLSLYAYSGNILQDHITTSGVVGAGNKLSIPSWKTGNYDIQARSAIYRGTDVSSGILEALSVNINY